MHNFSLVLVFAPLWITEAVHFNNPLLRFAFQALLIFEIACWSEIAPLIPLSHPRRARHLHILKPRLTLLTFSQWLSGSLVQICWTDSVRWKRCKGCTKHVFSRAKFSAWITLLNKKIYLDTVRSNTEQYNMVCFKVFIYLSGLFALNDHFVHRANEFQQTHLCGIPISFSTFFLGLSLCSCCVSMLY